MPTLKRKAFAYITNAGRLLVFRQPRYPEAGIQVPAGTITEEESPEIAVMREAYEETGLADLTLIGYLGERMRDLAHLGIDEIHHRYFYHIECGGDPPVIWRHIESDPYGSAEPVEFELFWVTLPDGVPELIGEHDVLLSILIDRMRSAAPAGDP